MFDISFIGKASFMRYDPKLSCFDKSSCTIAAPVTVFSLSNIMSILSETGTAIESMGATIFSTSIRCLISMDEVLFFNSSRSFEESLHEYVLVLCYLLRSKVFLASFFSTTSNMFHQSLPKNCSKLSNCHL
jgi:hypothetical protein